MFCHKVLARSNGATPARLSSSTRTLAPHSSFSKAATAAAATTPTLTTISTVFFPRRLRGLATTATKNRNNANTSYLGEEKDIAVIGGGITGLTTAHYLAKNLPDGATVTLYESSNRLGGWIDTQKVEFEDNGSKNTVMFERGPRTLRSYAGDLWKMDDLALYDLLHDVGIQPIFRKGGSRYVHLDGKIVSLDFRGMSPYLTVRRLTILLFRVLWHRKRLRVTSMERMHDTAKRPPEDMSVGDFIRTAFGRSSPLVETLASAALHGIWGGDIERLSMRSVSAQIWWNAIYKDGREITHMPEHEARLLRVLGKKPHVRDMAKQSRKGSLITFSDGLGTLPKAIAAGFKGNPNVKIRLGTPVTGLEFDGISQKVMLSTEKDSAPTPYDRVISTANSAHLSALAPGLLPSLGSVESVTITGVNLWYPKPALNKSHRGLGYLVPRSQPDPSPSNNKSKSNPDYNDGALLGAFFDSDALPEPSSEKTEVTGTKVFVLFRGALDEKEAVAKARDILHRDLAIDPDERCVAISRVNRDCIPQHNVGHSRLMTSAGHELARAFGGRLAVAGPSYSAVGVVGSVRAGYSVAEDVAVAAHAGVGVKVTGLEQFPAAPGEGGGADGNGDDGELLRPIRLVPVTRRELIDFGRRLRETIPRVVHWFS